MILSCKGHEKTIIFFKALYDVIDDRTKKARVKALKLYKNFSFESFSIKNALKLNN